MAQVEIYTKMLCPFCTRAKKLLASKGASFAEYDITMGGRGDCSGWSNLGGGMTFQNARQLTRCATNHRCACKGLVDGESWKLREDALSLLHPRQEAAGEQGRELRGR